MFIAEGIVHMYFRAAAGLALGLMSTDAKAAFIFDFIQSATGVTETGMGSFDLSKTLVKFNNASTAYVDPSRPSTQIGSGFHDFYKVTFTNHDPFGTGGSVDPTSTSGPIVAFDANATYDIVDVPTGYKSGATLSGSKSFFSKATLSSLGIDPGSTTYTYETATGTDSITVEASISVVPLPASAPLFGAALIGLAGLGYVAKRGKTATV